MTDTCHCLNPWYDTDLSGRSSPCSICGGDAPGPISLLQERISSFASPTGRIVESTPGFAVADLETRPSAGHFIADVLERGDGYKLYIYDENGVARELQDIDAGTVDYAKVEERALALCVEDKGTAEVRLNKQLATYALGMDLAINHLRDVDPESGHFDNRKGRRARQAEYRKNHRGR